MLILHYSTHSPEIRVKSGPIFAAIEIKFGERAFSIAAPKAWNLMFAKPAIPKPSNVD